MEILIHSINNWRVIMTNIPSPKEVIEKHYSTYSALIAEYGRFIEINNGTSHTHTGERNLVFSPSGELRPITRIKNSGYRFARGTSQMAFLGDFIVSASLWSSHDVIDISIKSIDENEVNTVWTTSEMKWNQDGKPEIFKGLTSEQEEWLLNIPGSFEGNYIPKEWLPKRFQDIPPFFEWVKRNNLEKFAKRFPGCLTDNDVEEAISTSRKYINLIPIGINFDPEKYEAKLVAATGCACEINQTEKWFGYKSQYDAQPTKIQFASNKQIENHESGNSQHADSMDLHCGLVGWKNFKYLVRIRRDIITWSGYGHGCGIDVFEL